MRFTTLGDLFSASIACDGSGALMQCRFVSWEATMSMKFWTPLALALMLVLVGCGDDEGAPTDDGSATQETSDAPQQQSDGTATTDDASTQDERVARDAEDGGAADQAMSETSNASTAEPSQEDAGELTDAPSALGAPDDGEAGGVLDESEAMPGETSSDDVEDIIQETERRFDEASQKIDEQFKEAEQETPEPVAPESETGADLDAALESSSELPGPEDATTLEEASSDPEVRAILEETERRFEEASQEIDRQFEQAESRVPDEISDSTTVSGEDEATSSEDNETTP
ncbi:hypothetical protein RSO41_11645 [Halomonas sp. I1]|uniref:hypothetical protein n=1 Tax=Halomonas sp. I1 TaxID=393536 RepID=UPI0028DDB9B8|nr:hypothetical protein [Halomonas sp. I1]MDT8895307.1 hypothetical protein [Halomonas sp. I1]